MRRGEREIRDEAGIQEILEQGHVCRLGLFDGQYPYVVPMNYGYRKGCLYVHSAPEGRKIDILKKNNRVCIEVDVDCRIVRGDAPCRWAAKYRSVIGFGRARIVDDESGKKAGLDAIMAHYGGQEGLYDDQSLQRTCVIEVAIERMTGKQSL